MKNNLINSQNVQTSATKLPESPSKDPTAVPSQLPASQYNFTDPDHINQADYRAEILQLLHSHSIPSLDLVFHHKTLGQSLKIDGAGSAYNAFLRHWEPGTLLVREETKACLLTQSGNLIGIFPCGRGGVSSCTVNDAHLVGAAILANASSIILCHNHPSGNLQPSTSDYLVTKRVQKLAGLFGIRVLDHLVINPSDYYSFAEEGLME